MPVRLLLLLLMLLPAPALAGAATGIAAVQPDGTLTADGGVVMRLAHVRLPVALGPAAAPLHEAALALLRKTCLGQPLEVVRLGSDRWQRPLVAIRAAGGDLEEALLAEGLAVVDPREGVAGDLAPLFAAEAQARREKRGLWAAALLVHAADGPIPESGFGIVEGRVAETARVRGRIYVNFGADYKTDFTVLVEGDTARALLKGTPSALDLAGYRVRVRGMLEEWNGPLLRLAGPRDMEILSDPSGNMLGQSKRLARQEGRAE